MFLADSWKNVDQRTRPWKFPKSGGDGEDPNSAGERNSGMKIKRIHIRYQKPFTTFFFFHFQITLFSRRKPEKKTLMLRRETRQVIWSNSSQSSSPNQSRTNYEGALELREVKEIRWGKSSKDFEKWPEDSKKTEFKKCFIVYYGSEFKLRTLSVVALSEKECEMWIKGLKYMVPDTCNSPYPLQVERWLRKEFYQMENANKCVALKEVKSFLPKINCKISTGKLNEQFMIVDTRRRNEIGFDDFTKLYQNLVMSPNTLNEIFNSPMAYSSDGEIVTLQEFQKFLKDQNDPMGNDEKAITNFIREFVQDTQREIQEPYLTVSEFVDYLFSKQNEIWNSECDKVYMDMTKPLSRYWISSSHNTYLTGDQFSSESSTEAYVRALRMGCRCIELDCWDGPDNMPLIFHGHTFTTKIKFRDVVQTIKEHAFVTSPYPLILSIEQNCSLAQQRKMAQCMIEVFGDMLLIQQIEKNETQLPSPYQLRRKIILKHKKLPEGASGQCFNSFFGDDSNGAVKNDGVLVRSDDNELDIRNTVKNGILFLCDPVDKIFNPHFFVLTQKKLYYTDIFK
jgi:phosphatidylinositol phospholipase C gamma-1